MQAAVQVRYLRAAGTLVQVVHVLRDDDQFGHVARQRRNGAVRGVRFGAQRLCAAPFIPAPDHIGMRAERFGCGQCLRIKARPQTGQGIAEGGDAAFRGNPGAGEDDDALCAV
ncbi:hypothetical protein G6F50_015622 [Rhizopus delemar]|uniref:Uncharacterized protein n=1 Tax=Rhizopus delemar TaxID=936053 RepID=A0A9P6XWQ0_9FUNG|nr:hypothetical protein G6F50_015622 [Rhizopus delemar]